MSFVLVVRVKTEEPQEAGFAQTLCVEIAVRLSPLLCFGARPSSHLLLVEPPQRFGFFVATKESCQPRDPRVNRELWMEFWQKAKKKNNIVIPKTFVSPSGDRSHPHRLYGGFSLRVGDELV